MRLLYAAEPIMVVCCYAQRDQGLRNELGKYLSSLENEGFIKLTYNRQINPHGNWNRKLENKVVSAQIVLLLISPDFFDSGYASGAEMREVLQRFSKQRNHVAAIMLRPTDLKNTPYSDLQTLPKQEKPVTGWENRDDAFKKIAEELRVIINGIFNYSMAEAMFKKGTEASSAGRYKEAIAYYDKSLELEPNEPRTYFNKGNAFQLLKRFKEAVNAYNQAILLDSRYVSAYLNKGVALDKIGKSTESLATYDQALEIEPDNVGLHFNRANMLYVLHRYEEVFAELDRVIRLDPHFVDAFYNKAALLGVLKRYEEALQVYEDVYHLDPDNSAAQYHRYKVLLKLNRKEEANNAFEKYRELRARKRS